MKLRFSCKDCDKRSVGCHATCEDYIRQKVDHEDLKEQIYQAKKTYYDAVSASAEGVMRMKKRRNRHGKRQAQT